MEDKAKFASVLKEQVTTHDCLGVLCFRRLASIWGLSASICSCVCVGVRASASWLNVGATSSGHMRAWAWVRAWACVGRRGSRLPSVFCSPKHLCVGVSVCVSPVCGPVCVEARGVDTGPSLTVMKATVTV